MAIFDNELIDNVASTPELPVPYLTSPEKPEVNVELDMSSGVNLGGFGSDPGKKLGMSMKEMSSLSGLGDKRTFTSTPSLVSRGELSANQKYPLYERGVDLENIYGLQQGGLEQLGHSLVKAGATALGTFAQSFATIPNTISAIKSGKVGDLSGSPDGYESTIDTWLKNIEDYFPNYYTRAEKDHPWKAMIPFANGSANFWGDKVIKNLGFTVGAIGGALVQDAAIGVVTGGIGEIPLIAAQVGKASLWINKIFAVRGKLDKLMDIAVGLNKSEKTFLTLQKLHGAAQLAKLNTGFRYGMNLYGSARTEAAIEARDGYRQVKEELVRLYKLDNFNAEPEGDELQSIDDFATNAMNTRFGINMALLTVSNAVQFDNLFRSFSTASSKGIQGSAIKALEGGTIKSLGEAGEIGLKKGSLDTFEAIVPKTIGGKVWKAVKPKLGLMFTEGVYEEGGQFAAEKGTYDYYTRKYKDPSKGENIESWRSVNEIMKSTTEGLSEQFGSQEGIENMIIGAISAVISGGVMGQIDKMQGKGHKDRLTASINTLNQYGLTGILHDKYVNTATSRIIGREMKKAAKSGNIYEYKNLKHDMFYNFVTSRIPSGMHDVTIEQLNLLKDLSEEEFEKTFGMNFSTSNKKTVIEYVDNLIKNANEIAKTTKAIDETFKNPFKQIINPKTDEEAIEASKWVTFNNWKTELGYYNSVKMDIRNRMEDISKTLAKINPLLNNEIVASLNSREGLLELSSLYEERSNQLMASILLDSTIAQKKAIRAQVKALRTAGEKIHLALGSVENRDKYIKDIFNFELNNQEEGKEDIVDITDINNIVEIGIDLNRQNFRKKLASHALDQLTSEKGFNGYFDSAKDVNDDTLKKEVEEETTEAGDISVPKFINNLGVEQEIEEGRAYTSPGSKKSVVRKSGDRYKVTAPDGSVTFHSTKEKALEAANDINEDQQDLANVKVIGINPDGTIKVEDLAGNIQNISVAALSGYNRVETEQDRLLKNKEQLKKEQDDIDHNSGTVQTFTSTGDGTVEKAKDAPILFRSSTTESEDYIPEGGSAPHITRAREFFANIDMFKNRGKMKAILITPHLAKFLGLEGIVQMSYGVPEGTDISTIKDVDNLDLGWIAQVFVIKEKGKTYFVDKDGKRLTEVGKKADLNSIVFQTMPTTDLYWANKEPRFRAGQKEAATSQALAWRAYRKKMYSADPNSAPEIFDFTISRGIPVENEGTKERNAVADVLVTEEIINSHQDLIVIPTTGTLTNEIGELIPFENGVPVLKFGSILQRLDNRKFTSQEAKTIYEVIKQMSQDIVSQSENGEVIRINRDYISFLQNVLYWRVGDTVSNNQIRFNEETMALELGYNSYALSDIVNKGPQIIGQLTDAYIAANNKTLKTPDVFNDIFYEYQLDEKGELIDPIEWKNYQTYLLSNKYPDGSNRTDIPLTTSVAKRTASVPYSYKQKYSTLHGLDFPVIEVAQKEVIINPPKPDGTPTPDTIVIDGHSIDGTTENIYPKLSGPVSFIASLDKDGNIAVGVSEKQPTIIKISENLSSMSQVIDPELNLADRFDPNDSPALRAAKYVQMRIAVDLQGTYDKSIAPVKPVTPEAPEQSPEQETPVPPKPEPKKPAAPKKPDPNRFKNGKDNNEEYRRVGVKEKEMMTDAEITLFKIWHAENVPFIPFEILTQIITTHNGEKAWGAFENGVAKFVKGGLRGTEYHEIFEAIYKGILSLEQQQELLEEFKARKGQFTDRQTNKKIAFADATDLQAKERIADDFTEYRLGKLPGRTLGEKVRNFFKRILDFFKSFVSKPSLKSELFEAINAGKFKERTLNPNIDYSKAEYRPIEGLLPQQIHDFIQDMTARAAGILYAAGDKKKLFTPDGITSKELFEKIENEYKGIMDGLFTRRDTIGDLAWKELVDRTKLSLRALGVSFNENDLVSINEEETTSRLYAPEPFSQDWKKNSSGAIKFSLATLLRVQATNQENKLGLILPKALKDNSIGGYQLVNFSQVFATLIDNLSNTSSISKVVDKMTELAGFDSTYVRLFQRLGGKTNNKSMPFNAFDYTDWRYFIQFTQTFTKQKPDALIQYKTGIEVYTAPASLFTAVKQVQNNWIENIKIIALAKDGFISYNKPTKTYQVKSFKAVVEEAPNDKFRVISPDGTIVNYDTLSEANKAARKADIKITTPKQMISFLEKIGISFPMEVYTKLKSESFKGVSNQQVAFAEAVSRLYSYFGKNKDIMSVSNKTLGINGPLSTIAELYVKVTNPNQDSTHYGVEGEQRGSFADNNVPSIFENEFNEANTLDELLEKRSELNDLYSRGSQVLKKGGLFFDKDGNRIKNIKISYIQGTKLLDDNKGTSTISLSKGDRFTQEINQNLDGNYYIMIPADGSTEWMMNMGNHVKFKELENGKAWTKAGGIYSIFRGYLEDDIALALDFANREHLRSMGKRGKELRFFKGILSTKDLTAINELIAKNSTKEKIFDYVDKNIGDINLSIKQFIETSSKETFDLLVDSKQIQMNIFDSNQVSYSYAGLQNKFAEDNGFNKLKTSEKLLRDVITYSNLNYIINNIEYHKVLFGDPYQFASTKTGGLEATKRYKSFFSPRRTTFDTPELNTFLNNNLNSVDKIRLKPGMPGYHLFKSHLNTATVEDVVTAGSLSNLIPNYARNNETDGMSWLMDGAYREIKIKNGQWDFDGTEEAWHQWQMAWTRQNMPGYDYKNAAGVVNEALKKHDKALLFTKEPKHTIEVLKPIVTGNKASKNQFDLVLDKFSQVPVYYSMVKGTNLEKLYLKMMNEKIDYVIVESGRKAGGEKLHPLYNSKGEFNEDAFNNETKIPWKAYGIQVETASEGGLHAQTRGSQITKIVSIDLFENGDVLGTSPERQEVIKKAYERNIKILDLLHQNAYNELLKKIGVRELDGGFVMKDGKAISETLMYELLRRQVSENTVDTIDLDENNQFVMPFEASPSYVQIRNIMYSLIDKALISPKMNGGAHVQVATTMFESALEGRSLMMKNKNKEWVKITKEDYDKLTDKEKLGVVLTDDTLKFYTKEDPYCEIMLPHWFGAQLSKMLKIRDKNGYEREMNQQELLDYINNSEDGKEILKGIGFRIPTQALSSAEIFRVKGFLPDYMGSTVIVPSQITTKAGSDFDIDKLNMYLKSIWVDNSGKIHLVKYKGSEEATKEFYGDLFDKGQLLTKKQLEQLDEVLLNASATSILTDGLIFSMFEDVGIFLNTEDEYTSDFIQSLTEQGVKETVVNNLYKKSLENEYYNSLEELMILPENFERMIAPIDDAGLKKTADYLNELKGNNKVVNNRLLNRNFMTSLRHSFSMGKKWVGVVAVNITNLSLKQKSQVYIDDQRIKNLPASEQKILGDGKVILPHNTIEIEGKEYISLSGRTVKGKKELISSRYSGYGTAVVDVAKDDFITTVIESDLVIGTFMFLENIGVGGKNTALFMHQPIISRYLEMLDAEGSRNLFGVKRIEAIKSTFITSDKALAETSIDINNFEGNIRNYYSGKELTLEENAEQHKILDEFVKYAMMASYNFKFTQSTNYDTSKFRSAETLTRKQLRTEIAEDTNIITSARNILKSTHIGEQQKLITLAINSMGAVFKLDAPAFRFITDRALKTYAENDYLSADKYEKIGLQVKAAFLDYIIQTRSDLTDKIPGLLVNSETNIAIKLAALKDSHPELRILEDLQVVSGSRVNGAKSIKLKVNLKEAYDENLYIGYMRELRDYDDATKDFYNDLVDIALLQGTYSSAISIRNIIPLEDFSAIVTPIVESLQATDDLMNFTNGFFERNNFKNPDVVKVFNPKFFEWGENPVGQQVTKYGEHYADIYEYKSFLFPNVPGLNLVSNQRKIMFLNDTYNSFDLKYDYLKVPRVVVDRYTGDAVDMQTGRTITAMSYAIMKQKGDPSLGDFYGYKKVRHITGEPLVTYTEYKGVVSTNHVYKLINLYGDSERASEHYDNTRESVIDNGTVRVEREMLDSEIVNNYGGEFKEKDLPLQKEGMGQQELFSPEEFDNKPEFNKLPGKSDTPTMTYAGIGSRQTPADVLAKMTEAAEYLEGLGYTLRSGGAIGADQAFEKGVKSKKEVFLGTDKTGEREKKIAREIHPNPQALDNSKSKATGKPIADFMWNLMGRNTNQIFGENLDTPVDFVLAWTQDGLTDYRKRSIQSGGTGQAIDMASRKGIPVINMFSPDWREQLDQVLTSNKKDTISQRQKNLEDKGYSFIQGDDSTWDVLNNNPDGSGLVGEYFSDINTALDAAEKDFNSNKKEDATVTPTIEIVGRYSVKDLKDNPDKVYIFGDNVQRIGKGGQAIIRDESNAFGIVTKLEPNNSDSAFMSDDALNDNMEMIDRDITELKDIAEFRTLVFPKDGIGTGLAQLKQKAPKTYEYLNQRLLDEFGFNNDKGIIQAKTEEVKTEDKTFEEIIETLTPKVEVKKDSPKFTYKGVTIDTEFQLTEGQRVALEKLIDFSTDPSEETITLQGAAGTGKTSVIGYLQKYLKQHNFNFLAPTHAATAELAFATVKTGNKQFPMTVASGIINAYNKDTGEMTPQLTRKLTERLGLRNNVFVIDEVSMLNSNDYENVKLVASRNKIKVIFMGDMLQIPEVNVRNPKKKLISKAFSDNEQVVLTEVKRTNSDSILNMLTNIRNNINDQIPIVPSSDKLEYLSLTDFNLKMIDVFEKNPEGTVLINYTNKGAEYYNKKIRESLGLFDAPKPGDIVVGYLGYQNKQIENQNIANSIRYTIQSVTKDGSLYKITAKSKKLEELEKLGVSGASSNAYTSYAQLSRTDSFDFPDLNNADFEANNEMFSQLMKPLYESKQIALRTKSPRDWASYFAVKGAVSKKLSKFDIGGKYIYNPTSGSMEKYEYELHKNIDVDLIIDKGVDYGYAITIHKSQGSTVENVFFEASSLPTSSSSKLMMNGKQVSTEKHSLLYVGVSRASKYLGINAENSSNFYTPSTRYITSSSEEASETPKGEDRFIMVNQFKITVKPDGKMFYQNGNEVVDQTTKNKLNVRMELQDGTLRTATYNGASYFILSDNRIVGSGVTNLGKESITNQELKELLLSKAILYKNQC